MPFRLLSSNQLNTAANLYKGLLCHWCGCANNVHPFNGERGNDILFSLYYVRLHGDCFVSEQLLLLIVVSVGKPHRRFPSYGQVSANPGCFAYLFSLTQHRTSYVLGASSYRGSAFAPCLHFTGGLLLRRRACLFYMNSPLTQLTTNHAGGEVRERSKPPSWQRKVPFKIRQSPC